ncbi:hypothetical protein HPB50_007224 [Hyalomma asiaticum]|uniref:Uncharacterized protein n=1 Tax=Hyalomma asiaticum TaxID=266040 RepID=A0ACB7SW20_HYAAI|nr:hypothetical protein HPB50_007224 [Hyalomma asiaticum]
MADHLLSVDHDALERQRCQEHQHTHTCYKGGRKKCRFHAPFWPMPSTKVLTPLQAPTDDDETGLKRYRFLKNTHDALHSALPISPSLKCCNIMAYVTLTSMKR